ncbi:MAG: carboxypeptidase-like regulatory domain-containing protein, partial [Planctomycetota bacterium]
APVPAPAAEPEVTTVFARLIDEAGGALAGAELRSVYVSGEPRGADCFGLADGAGQARIDIPDRFVRGSSQTTWEMTFRASAPMRATAFVASEPRWHGTTDLGDVELERGGAVLGYVVDAAGLPVEGAAILLSRGALVADVDELRLAGPDAEVRRPLAVSGADGAFRFPGAAVGACRLLVGAEGRLWTVSDELTVRLGSWTDAGTLVLEDLPRQELLEGVVYRPSGEPAAGARVSYHAIETEDEGVVEADDRGRFVYPPGGAQSVDFVARDPSGEHSMSPAIRATRGQRDLRLELTPRHTIALQVVDGRTGDPLTEAHAMPLLAEGYEVAEGGTWIVGENLRPADGEGRLLLDLPPGSIRLFVRRRGYQSVYFGPWTRDEIPAELTVELEPEPRLEGRVVAYGEPVAGARIDLAYHRDGFIPLRYGFPMRFLRNDARLVTADADGRFSCAFDPDWKHVFVLARAPGWARGEAELDLTADAATTGIELQLTHGGTVAGTVTPPLGHGPKGLVVAATCGDGRPVFVRTDELGDYRLEGLMPGSWHVEALLEEPSGEIMSIARTDEQKDFRWNVDVADGETSRLDLDARGLAGAELSGRFTVDGEPPAGFTAARLPGRFERYTDDRPAVELDEDGRFALQLSSGKSLILLSGTLPDGERIEVIRELHLEGGPADWEEDLRLGWVDATVKQESGRLRMHVGSWEGDRVSVYLDAGPDGRVQGAAPIGKVSIQRQRVLDARSSWWTVSQVEAVER